MQHKPVRELALLGSMLLALGLMAATPAALAYGSTDQWQAGFSGTCLAPTCAFIPGGPFGFWGWCAFGGSSGSSAVGTTGTTGDCQIAFYSTSNPVKTIHASFDLSSWTIATGSIFLPTGVPGFFFTGGTVELNGPGAALVGIPTGVPIPLSALCNFSNIPTSLIGNPICDSGIPAVPGHHPFNPFPGFSIQIQVTKVS